MEKIDYAPLLPTEPPEGLVAWLLKEGLLKKELLIYRADWYTEPLSEEKERVVKLTCTACHRSQYADKVENQCHNGGPAFGFIHPETREVMGSGRHCHCPMCGAEVAAVHIGNMGQWQCVEAYPMTVHKLGDKLALCGWCVKKWFEKDGRSGITVWPYEAYVVEERAMIRLTAYTKCLSTISLHGKWEQRKQFIDAWGRADLVYPWKKSLLEGTTAENSKLDLFWKNGNKGGQSFARPVTYLKLWRKHPNLENLVMQGAGMLVAELIDDELEHRHYMYPKPKGMPELGLNWKEQRPAQMLGLNREELRRCLADGWNAETLSYFREQKERGRILSREELALCSELGFACCRTLVNDGQNPLFVARYLLRQKKKDTRCDIHILNDYWQMAAQCEYDLKNIDIRYPPNLYRVHERVREEIDRRRDVAERQRKAAWAEKQKQEWESRAPLMKARCEALSAFAWKKDGILIRPAESEAELYREGELLHHCVGTYAQRMAEGGTAIFLIRRANAPDRPWYTLELDEKRLEVRQNRGSRNCERTPAVRAFEEAWVAWIRSITQSKKAGAKAPVHKKKEGNAA